MGQPGSSLRMFTGAVITGFIVGATVGVETPWNQASRNEQHEVTIHGHDLKALSAIVNGLGARITLVDTDRSALQVRITTNQLTLLSRQSEVRRITDNYREPG